MKKLLSFVFCLFMLLTLVACEDDPILTPSGESEEDCTGSYCRLQLIPKNLFSIPTKNALHWMNDSSNPEIF